MKFHECVGITFNGYCNCFASIENFAEKKSAKSFITDDEQEFGCSPNIEAIKKRYLEKGIFIFIKFLLIFEAYRKKKILALIEITKTLLFDKYFIQKLMKINI